MISPKSKAFVSLILKIAISVCCICYLYYEFFVKQKFQLLWDEFNHTSFTSLQIFYAVLALMLVMANWGIESIKWKFLLKHLEKITLLRAFRSVLSGVSISIFTPNRVGEFAARIFYLQPSHRMKGILVSVIGSISQLCVTLVAGSFGLAWFYLHYTEAAALEIKIVMVLPFLFSTFCMLLYFNIAILRRFLLGINKGRKTRFYLQVFNEYTLFDLLRIILLSLVRFLVFTMQYYLLLLFFGVPVTFIESLMLTSAIFFVMAIVPSFALTELGVRGAVAVYFMAVISGNELSILAASYLLWCINLALPALAGLLFLLPLKFFKK